MIQRVCKNNDVVIELEMNLENLLFLELEYYTDGVAKYIATLDNLHFENGKAYVYIPSAKLMLMEDGQLRCKVRYAYENLKYADGQQDRCIHQILEAYIYG